MKFKKISPLLLISSTAFAGTMGPIATDVYGPKEGVYLGAGAGASINKDKLTVTDVVTHNTVTETSNNTEALGNVFLGLGHTFYDSWYLGAEANLYSPRTVQYRNRPGATDIGVRFSDKYVIHDNFTADLLPGYRFNPNTLLYARVGMGFRTTQFNQQAVTLASQAVADSNYSVIGRFGAGVTYALTQHLGASVDYFYSYAPTFGTYSPIITTQFNFKPASNYIGGSLVYTI